MGKISDEILELVKKQIKERGIVVWYDPEKAYSSLVHALSASGITVLHYEDGFFRLREKLEPYLEFVDDSGQMRPEADIPPEVVVYVPLARHETNFALIEAETAGVVIEPEASRSECNTKLSLAVERVFNKIAPAKAQSLARQAEEGLLSVEELDRLVEEVGGATGILQVVFGPVSIEEIILEFAASDSKDKDLMEKNALPEIVALLHQELGFEELDNKQIRDVRQSLRKFLLTNEFLSEIGDEDMPNSLQRLPRSKKQTELNLVRNICHLWRNRVDLKEFYIEASRRVEEEIRLSDISVVLSTLKSNETFFAIDRLWLKEAAKKIIERKPAEALEIARDRLSLFWARERPESQIQWKVIEAASNICLQVAEIKEALKKQEWDFDQLIKAYTQYAAPWMTLDRSARLMESLYAGLEISDSDEGDFEKAIIVARHSYVETLQEMALAYSKEAIKAGFNSALFRKQNFIYKDIVKECLEKGEKTAYYLVDALRYELAADILEAMSEEYEGRIEPRIGQLPGITAIGMAALLPGAEGGIQVEIKGNGFYPLVGGQEVSTRQTRLNYIKEKSGLATAIYRLGEITKLTPKRRKEIESSQLIIITSQEIDRFAEEAGAEEEARTYIDSIPDKIWRSIRSLAKVGVKWFIIATDHGFHLIDSLDPGMFMDGPGGNIVELHPRVWIGQGGVAREGFFRVKAADIGLSSSLEFAFPRSLGVFKVKGGVGKYFHGGVSLQEHIIPVLIIKSKVVRPITKSLMGIKISYGRAKITNRLFTVTVEAEKSGIFAEEGRRIRLEVLAGKEEVGKAVAAGYDFDDRKSEIIVRPGQPNVITLMLYKGTSFNEVTIQAVDVESQLILDSIKDIPVELMI